MLSPEFGELEVTVRHTERDYLNGLSEQIKKIFEGPPFVLEQQWI